VALDRDHLDVFYYISASEIWPEKRSGLWWEITGRYLPKTCFPKYKQKEEEYRLKNLDCLGAQKRL
jgi:hypothetical protein